MVSILIANVRSVTGKVFGRSETITWTHPTLRLSPPQRLQASFGRGGVRWAKWERKCPRPLSLLKCLHSFCPADTSPKTPLNLGGGERRFDSAVERLARIKHLYGQVSIWSSNHWLSMETFVHVILCTSWRKFEKDSKALNKTEVFNFSNLCTSKNEALLRLSITCGIWNSNHHQRLRFRCRQST